MYKYRQTHTHIPTHTPTHSPYAFHAPVRCKKADKQFRMSSLMFVSPSRPARKNASASSINRIVPLRLASAQSNTCREREG